MNVLTIVPYLDISIGRIYVYLVGMDNG